MQITPSFYLFPIFDSYNIMAVFDIFESFWGTKFDDLLVVTAALSSDAVWTKQNIIICLTCLEEHELFIVLSFCFEDNIDPAIFQVHQTF